MTRRTWLMLALGAVALVATLLFVTPHARRAVFRSYWAGVPLDGQVARGPAGLTVHYTLYNHESHYVLDFGDIRMAMSHASDYGYKLWRSGSLGSANAATVTYPDGLTLTTPGQHLIEDSYVDDTHRCTFLDVPFTIRGDVVKVAGVTVRLGDGPTLIVLTPEGTLMDRAAFSPEQHPMPPVAPAPTQTAVRGTTSAASTPTIKPEPKKR
jgi:hypothetical protein